MSKQGSSPITTLLKRTIIESGIPYKTLERETSVQRSSIQRFVDGRQSIRLDVADKLAVFFGLSLTKHATPATKKASEF
jgi:plasmid maintenance system antidote protein VapI